MLRRAEVLGERGVSFEEYGDGEGDLIVSCVYCMKLKINLDYG